MHSSRPLDFALFFLLIQLFFTRQRKFVWCQWETIGKMLLWEYLYNCAIFVRCYCYMHIKASCTILIVIPFLSFPFCFKIKWCTFCMADYVLKIIQATFGFGNLPCCCHWSGSPDHIISYHVEIIEPVVTNQYKTFGANFSRIVHIFIIG